MPPSMKEQTPNPNPTRALSTPCDILPPPCCISIQVLRTKLLRALFFFCFLEVSLLTRSLLITIRVLRYAGHGKPFAGDYSTKGLYAYSSGKFDGMAFFGINGNVEQMSAPPDERGGQYRPLLPAEIVKINEDRGTASDGNTAFTESGNSNSNSNTNTNGVGDNTANTMSLGPEPDLMQITPRSTVGSVTSSGTQEQQQRYKGVVERVSMLQGALLGKGGNASQQELRQYWMKDVDCKDCYDCGKPFHTFRRRHHCRVCGQIFCWKCCIEVIPGAILGHTGDLRCCNYCSRVIRESNAIPSRPKPDALQSVGSGSGNVPGTEGSAGNSRSAEFAGIRAASSHTLVGRAADGQPLDADEVPGAASKRLSAADKVPSTPSGFAGSILTKISSTFRGEDAFVTEPETRAEVVKMLRRAVADGSLNVTKHRDRMVTYNSCFVAQEFVDWIMSWNTRIRKRSQAEAIGQTLVTGGFLLHVSEKESSGNSKLNSSDANRKVSFKDEYLLFRVTGAVFNEDRQTGGALRGMLDNDEAGPAWFNEISHTRADSHEATTPPVEMPLGAAAMANRMPGTPPSSIPEEASGPLPLQLTPPRTHRTYSIGSAPRQSGADRARSPFRERTKSDVPTITQNMLRLSKERRSTTERGNATDSGTDRKSGRLPSVNSEGHNEVDSAFIGVARDQVARIILQGLEREGLVADWAKTVHNLVDKVVNNVSPNVPRGDQMDIRRYIKFQCVPGGAMDESTYFRGALVRKNIVHKKMRSMIDRPRILILKFALEYQRVEHKYASIGNLLLQERGYLQNLVSKITWWRPDVVVVERAVSRIAQELLLDAGITLLLNLTQKEVDYIARCTEAEALRSIEGINFYQKGAHKLGSCERFIVRNVRDSGGKKHSFASFEGCTPEVGCTIMLRGSAAVKELEAIRHVVFFAAHAAYSLRLERCLLESQHIHPLAAYTAGSALAARQAHAPTFTSTFDPMSPASSSDQKNSSDSKVQVGSAAGKPEKIVAVTALAEAFYAKLATVTLSTSPYVKFPIPYLYGQAGQKCPSRTYLPLAPYQSAMLDGSPTSNRKDVFRAQNHQTITVLYSLSKDLKGIVTPCIDPTVVSMDFFGRNDMTLGNYVEHNCLNPLKQCPNENCHDGLEAHTRAFTHNDGRLIISAERLKAPFEHPDADKGGSDNADQVYMWSWCKICQQLTRVLPMTAQTASISLAKYLELSFYGGDFAPLSNECDHSVYRHHIRYFGQGSLLVFFEYEQIKIQTMVLPPRNIMFPAPSSSQREWETCIADMSTILRTRFADIMERINSVAPAELGPKDQNHPDRISREEDRKRSLEIIKWLKARHEQESQTLREQVSALAIFLAAAPMAEHAPTSTSTNPAPTFSTGTENVGVDHTIKLEQMVWACHKEIEDCIQAWNTAIQEAFTQSVTKRYAARIRTAAVRALENDKKPNRKTSKPSFQDVAGADITSVEPGVFTPGVGGTVVSLGDDATNGGDDSATEDIDGDVVSAAADTKLTATVAARWQAAAAKISHVKKEAKSTVSDNATQPRSNQSGLGGNDAGDVVGANGAGAIAAVASTAPLLSATIALAKAGRNDLLEMLKRLNHTLPPGTPGMKPIPPPFPMNVHHSVSSSSSAIGMSIYEDEPSSIIAYTLLSDAHAQYLASDGKSASAVGTSSNINAGNNYRGGSSSNTAVPTGTDILLPEAERNKLLEDGFAQKGLGVSPSKESAEETTTRASAEGGGIENSPQADRVNGGAPADPNTVGSVGNGKTGEDKDDERNDESNAEPRTGFGGEQAKQLASTLHFKHQFLDSNTNFFCQAYFAKDFRELREQFYSSVSTHSGESANEAAFMRSLSRCLKWDPHGGKSRAEFCKMKDERLILKQMTRAEANSVVHFIPHYIEHMREASRERRPTVLARILGIYRIGFRNEKTGRTMKQEVLIMENVFYNRQISQTFDLKGSMRNRYAQTSERDGLVMLDENLVELMHSDPIYLRDHDKHVLKQAIQNDTAFLAAKDVMDYSLLVGVDEHAQELVVGVIDYIRTFTWDKRLEMYVKQSGILGGQGNLPTVISPLSYQERFANAMEKYFWLAPSRWDFAYTD